MRPARIVALIIGCLMLLPGIALLLGGGGLGIAYATGRNDAGYIEATLTGLRSPTEAITAQTPTLTTDLQNSTWLMNVLDADLRLRVTAPSSDAQIFVGIAPTADVDAYLGGVAHDQITGLTDGRTAVYRTSAGTLTVAPPTDQTFWVAQSSGPGTQELSWTPNAGQWTVVVMNADGSPGVTAVATVEVKAGFLLPLALTLLVLGVVITAGAVVLIVVGASGGRDDKRNQTWPPKSSSALPATGAEMATQDHPVAVTAHLDPGLSRWKWLVKWFLAIPHYFVLAFLWPAFVVVTIVAGFCILFTGRYPRSLFDFTSGVLRWTWRVSYYAASGGLGTDVYPPFTLGYAPNYPATLDIAYPARLTNGLVLIKWLLAVPHILIIGFLVSNWWGWTSGSDNGFAFGPVGTGGLLGLLVVITAVVLLFTGKYPPQLFALIVGFNRWIYRVVAYVALMTDKYPPFRLDQGGSEPTTPRPFPLDGPAMTPPPEPVNSRTGA